MFKHFPVIN